MDLHCTQKLPPHRRLPPSDMNTGFFVADSTTPPHERLLSSVMTYCFSRFKQKLHLGVIIALILFPGFSTPIARSSSEMRAVP